MEWFDRSGGRPEVRHRDGILRARRRRAGEASVVRPRHRQAGCSAGEFVFISRCFRSNAMFLRNRKRQPLAAAAKTVVENLEGRVLLAYTLDPSFDADGFATGAGGPVFVVQPDNKIVAPVNGYRALRRYNVDGSIDTTFNGAGSGVVSDSCFFDLDWAGGKLIASGGDKIARYNLNGTLDTTFGGGDGIAQVPFGIVEVIVAPDGKLVVVGSRSEPDP